MEKVKSIFFRGTLKGQGIVNFDSNDQKFTYRQIEENANERFDNISYSKKCFFKNPNNKLDYKVKISSNCLKHELFKDSFMFQSPNVMHNDGLLLLAIANPAAILRGFLYTAKEAPYKRTSPISLLDSVQTCNAKSYLDFHNRSGEKVMDENQADITLFKKESIGDITYDLNGSIDLKQLKFLSCDIVFDRLGLNYDLLEPYMKTLKKRLPNLKYEQGYYQMVGSDIQIPELGVNFSDETVNDLIRDFFRRVLSLNITKSGAYAAIDTLEYKLVYDVIKDKRNSEDGWVSLTQPSDFEDIEIFESYVLEDNEIALKLREDIDAKREEIKAANKKKKADEAEIKRLNNSNGETKVKTKKKLTE